MWQKPFIRPGVCIPACHDEIHHALTLKFSLNWDQNAARTTWHVPPQCWSYQTRMNKNMDLKVPRLPLTFPSMLPPSAGASASVETESCDAARAREDSGRKRGLPPCRWELRRQLVRTGWVWQKLARNLSSTKWPNMWVEQTCLNMCILTQTDNCTYKIRNETFFCKDPKWSKQISNQNKKIFRK